jgi:hypothetical protein
VARRTHRWFAVTPLGRRWRFDAPVRLRTQQLEAEKHYADLLQRYGQLVGHLLMRRE